MAPAHRERNAAAREAWWRQIRDWKEEHPLTPEISTTEIKPQHLMREIDRLSGGRAIVELRRRPAPDVGRAIHPLQRAPAVAQLRRPRIDGLRFAGRHRRAVRLPRQAGIRDRAATADSRCRIPELATIVNHGLPIKIIVMNNGYLGMIRQWQELFYNNRLSARPS